MALTRGKKRTTTPVSGEFARMGVQKPEHSAFSVLQSVVKPIQDSLIAKEKFDLDVLQSSHKKYMSDAKDMRLITEEQKRKFLADEKEKARLDAAEKKALAKLKKDEETLRKQIFDANQKNVESKLKLHIKDDILRTVTALRLEHAGKPTDFAEAIQSYKDGYVSADTFPKNLYNSKGVELGDFRQYFEVTLNEKYIPHYATMATNQRKTYAVTSWNHNKLNFDATLNDITGQMGQIGNELAFETTMPHQTLVTSNTIQQMELILKGAYNSYGEWVSYMQGLTQEFPDKYQAEDVANEINRVRQTMDSHMVANFAKLFITGTKDTDTEHATAIEFIDSWYNNEFNENHPTDIGKAMYMWTYTDHDQGAQDAIRSFALQEVSAKVKVVNKKNSEKIANINKDSKLIKARWYDDDNIIGNLKFDTTSAHVLPSRDEITYANTSYDASGTKTVDEIGVSEDLKTVFQNEKLTEDFNSLRKGKKDIYQVIHENRNFGDDQQIIDAYYLNVIDGPYSGYDIISRTTHALNNNQDIRDDDLIKNFMLAFEDTNQYPTSFLQAVNSLSSMDPKNENQMEDFASLLHIFNYNKSKNGGMDGQIWGALDAANQYIKSGSVNKIAAVDIFLRHFEKNTVEEDVIKDQVYNYDRQWFDNFVYDITDEATDKNDWLQILWKQSSWIPEKLWDWNPEDDINIEKESNVWKQAGTSWRKRKASEVEDALNTNKALLDFMIREEAIHLYQKSDINRDDEGMERLFRSAAQNVFQRLNKDIWSFDNTMFNENAPHSSAAHLTQHSIMKHTGWSKDIMSGNAILQIMAVTNAMKPDEAADFWETTNWQSKMDNLNNMWMDNRIKFKFDERSRDTNNFQWHIMVDVDGNGTWRALRNPENYDYSWSPSGASLVDNVNQASIKTVQRKIINDFTNDQIAMLYEKRENKDTGEIELWTKIRDVSLSGATDIGWRKVESGEVSRFDMEVSNALGWLVSVVGNDIERFKDIFSDWKDVDTFAEYAQRNQEKVLAYQQQIKEEIENPDPIISQSRFQSLVEKFDVPNSNQVGDYFYMYDHKFIDNNYNVQSYKAIGPGLMLQEGGYAPNEYSLRGTEILLTEFGYNKKEIEKIMTGEMGITKDDYGKLIDKKYKEAELMYKDNYDDVIITPFQKEILIDMIASIGIRFVQHGTPIYDAIHSNNHYQVYNELQALAPFYTNKSRHAWHVNMWATQSNRDNVYMKDY